MNSNQKKVLFFTSGAVGGAERVTLTIAKILEKNGFEVKIVHVCRTIKGLDKLVPEEISQYHLKIINIRDFVTLRMFKLIKKEKPFAVFSSLHYLNIRVIVAAKLAGIKKIIVRNNIGWNAWPKELKILSKLTYPKASAIITQTDEMNTEFTKVFGKLQEKVFTIPNPVDLDSINEKTEKHTSPFDCKFINYLYVGRINPIKSIETLLVAFSKVVVYQHNAKLTIVGDYNENPQYFSKLKVIIAQYHLERLVDFVGFKSNPYIYMKYTNCMVLPSKREGNPNVLHEAMFLKTPVVATLSVPIVGRIVNYDRGIVVNVGDENAMANAMIRCSQMEITKPYEYTGGCQNFINLFK